MQTHTGTYKFTKPWLTHSNSICKHARGGKKKDVLDIFGAWVPMELCSMTRMNECQLPVPLVDSSDVLEFNFDWGANNTLPYDVFDALRLRHGIDVTGLNMSLTRGGNNYRSYVLMRGQLG